jgi:virulence-associated protein VapD
MYAIVLDLKIDDLKKYYGDPYNKAYDEKIKIFCTVDNKNY